MTERIMDACCLINLYASAEQASIMDHCGGVYVSRQVQSETLNIREVDAESPHKFISKQIDLNEAIETGQISVCRFDNTSEVELFVNFAMELDEGEASTLAIAKSRGWEVATDDKKARNIATQENIKLISTSELIYEWALSQNLDKKKIAEVLIRIQKFGKFRPRNSDPMFAWWEGIISSSAV